MKHTDVIPTGNPTLNWIIFQLRSPGLVFLQGVECNVRELCLARTLETSSMDRTEQETVAQRL